MPRIKGLNISRLKAGELDVVDIRRHTITFRFTARDGEYLFPVKRTKQEGTNITLEGGQVRGDNGFTSNIPVPSSKVPPSAWKASYRRAHWLFRRIPA